MSPFRHPEVRAKRASKGAGTQIGYSRSGQENASKSAEPISIGAEAVSFEARAAREHLSMTV